MKHKKLSPEEIETAIKNLDDFDNAKRALFFKNLFIQLQKDGENDSKNGRIKLGKLLKELSAVMEKVYTIYEELTLSNGNLLIPEDENIKNQTREISNSDYDSLLDFYKQWAERFSNKPKSLSPLLTQSLKISREIADLCRDYNKRARNTSEKL